MQGGTDVTGAVKHMKKSGALWIVIFAFAAGIIMLIIGANFKDSGGDDVGESDYEYDKEDFQEYKSGLEQSISGACRKILGCEVSVLLDFTDSGEVIYAQNTNTSFGGDKRQEYVIVGSGTSASPLYLGQKFPELSGIGIICSSGVSDAKKDEVCYMLCSAYGLPLTRIYVV